MSNTTNTNTSNTQSPAYIYGKALTIKTDKFGNDNLMVIVKRNHGYTGRTWEHNDTVFTNIKARHLKNLTKEQYENQWFRFMETGHGEYMGKSYISSFQIDALPQHMVDRLDREEVRTRMEVPFNELSDSEEEA